MKLSDYAYNIIPLQEEDEGFWFLDWIGEHNVLCSVHTDRDRGQNTLATVMYDIHTCPKNWTLV